MGPDRFKYKYTCAKCGRLAVRGLCSDCAGDNEKVFRMKGKIMSVGFHLGGGYGLINSAYYAAGLNLPCYQSFLNTPRRYWPTEFSSETVSMFKEISADQLVFFHAPYMINMVANPDTDNHSRRMSLHSLQKQYVTAARMGAQGLVTHVGSSKGQSPDQVDSLLLEFLHEFMADDKVQAAYNVSGTKLLLENDAGAGTQVAGDYWWLTNILHEVNQEIFGWCLDTAHNYAAGNDWNDPNIVDFFYDQAIPQYEESAYDPLASHQVYIPDLVHFNTPDPNVTVGSHLDRHASVLDEGAITLKSMERMYYLFRTLDVPMVIEGSPDREHDLRIALQWELDYRSGKSFKDVQ